MSAGGALLRDARPPPHRRPAGSAGGAAARAASFVGSQLDDQIRARDAEPLGILVALGQHGERPVARYGVAAGLLEHGPCGDAHRVALLVARQVALRRRGADRERAVVEADRGVVAGGELPDGLAVMP